ncbi:diacylglycerol-binding protein [Mycolicibacterium sp. XJ1819]
MKLRVLEVVVLFVLGAAASLVGDHSHVVTGTTEYFTDAVPFVWSSPIWFPLLVGLATVSIAELRLHLPAVRASATLRQCVAGVAAVLGIYMLTALLHSSPALPTTVLILMLAIVTWCVLGDGPGAICGALAAVIGPLVEVLIANTGVFAYNDDSDHLLGVGHWLPPLYFAFGVVVAMLGEFVAKDRRSATGEKQK